MARFGNAVIACKITELALSCASMGLQFYALPIPTKDAAVMQIPFGAYIIIVSGMLLGHITGDRMPRKIDLFFSITGIFIFVAAGEVADRHYIDCIYNQESNILDALVAAGAWIIVIVLFADSIFVYKNIPIEGD
ncbi:uncharacterized protein [Hetaerina americana]|uniref:uncharacterized protein n=1 Tax=Hetaerina americana TaxID=62018 RepID=UPI003A7F3771